MKDFHANDSDMKSSNDEEEIVEGDGGMDSNELVNITDLPESLSKTENYSDSMENNSDNDNETVKSIDLLNSDNN